MSSETGGEANLSLSGGQTAADSLPFSNSSGASSGNYSFPEGDDPELVERDEKYFCLVHGGLLKEPIQTSCGHRICKDCVEVYLGPNESKLCPAGEEDCMEVRRDNVYPDPGFRREINHVLVFCPFKHNGCPVKIKLGKLKDHKQECQYREVLCPYASRGCVAEVLLKDLDEHKKDCGFRPMSCDLCGIEFNANDKQEHDTTACPESTVKCRYKCGKKLKRRQLEDHLQSCPKKPTECPYKSLGCTFEVRLFLMMILVISTCK
ncbi:hypothetical protein EGW08_022811 [Elysia chlorotica]|uniref:TRAF-type domain-containing protein n=1 Tax=Elysia chlorotica TaxID=188477 RepID=A0A3S0Z2M9_ELYCH|nr:hypothetical protein EGW08_022811 [Elysia chlorotica]